ncbi:polysaccharide deacetylase [Candidatus Bathyarchaeota archaeon]|nr:MAG: polysaccharide deacetylase [Candidatus Bathyarchaeota archaeon]
MEVWPEGKRCAVFLSFDYDAESAEVWRFPKGVIEQSKGQFAPRVAIPRILDLLDRLEVKVTFFVPGWTAETYPETVQEILSRGHEVGAHGYLHKKLNEVSAEEEEGIFERMMTALTDVMGEKPLGFRAPYWLYSERTIDHLKRYGFLYTSDFMNDDMPYMLRYKGEETGLVELPVEWFLDDWVLFETHRKTCSEVYETWLGEFEGIHELGRYLCLTFHPQTIGRISRLRMLERLIREMKRRGDVWFPRGIDLARWWKERKA